MFTLRVIPKDNEPYDVTTNLFTVVAWERKFKRPASDMGKAMAMEWLAYLAYEASKQSGVSVPMVFDDFLKRLEAVEVVDQEAENPTEPGATPGV
jgi:hypothetical protein